MNVRDEDENGDGGRGSTLGCHLSTPWEVLTLIVHLPLQKIPSIKIIPKMSETHLNNFSRMKLHSSVLDKAQSCRLHKYHHCLEVVD